MAQCACGSGNVEVAKRPSYIKAMRLDHYERRNFARRKGPDMLPGSDMRQAVKSPIRHIISRRPIVDHAGDYYFFAIQKSVRSLNRRIFLVGSGNI